MHTDDIHVGDMLVSSHMYDRSSPVVFVVDKVVDGCLIDVVVLTCDGRVVKWEFVEGVVAWI